jgi:hypothetical protein
MIRENLSIPCGHPNGENAEGGEATRSIDDTDLGASDRRRTLAAERNLSAVAPNRRQGDPG